MLHNQHNSKHTIIHAPTHLLCELLQLLLHCQLLTPEGAECRITLRQLLQQGGVLLALLLKRTQSITDLCVGSSRSSHSTAYTHNATHKRAFDETETQQEESISCRLYGRDAGWAQPGLAAPPGGRGLVLKIGGGTIGVGTAALWCPEGLSQLPW